MLETPQLLERIARGRAAIAEAKAQGRAIPDWEVHLAMLERALVEELRAVAYAKADKISAMLGCDPLTAAINRVSWLICDLEDAGVPEDVIGPLRAEKVRLGALWEARQTEAA